jgi:hypothetical protein
MKNENRANANISTLEQRVLVRSGEGKMDDCLVAAVPERICSRENSLGSWTGDFVSCMMHSNNDSSPSAILASQQECTTAASSILSDCSALMQSSNMPTALKALDKDEFGMDRWLEEQEQHYTTPYPRLSLSGDFSLNFFEAERLAEAGFHLERLNHQGSSETETMPALVEASSLTFSSEPEEECRALQSSYSEQSISSDDDHDDHEDYKEPTTKRKRAMIRGHQEQDQNNNGRQKRRSSRKTYEPNVKVYVEYKDEDVLCQRGGLANSHPGNAWYHLAKEALQPKYIAASKTDKTDVSQELVDQVHAWGGRFLREDTSRAASSTSTSSCWYEVHNHVARTKAGQALREDYTPEKGAAKRVKYSKKQREEEGESLSDF